MMSVLMMLGVTIRRTTLLPESEKYRVPAVVSVIPEGRLSSALTAGPPSPV